MHALSKSRSLLKAIVYHSKHTPGIMMDEDAIKQKLVTQASLAVINILEPSPSLSKYTNGPRSHQRLYNIVTVVNKPFYMQTQSKFWRSKRDQKVARFHIQNFPWVI